MLKSIAAISLATSRQVATVAGLHKFRASKQKNCLWVTCSAQKVVCWMVEIKVTDRRRIGRMWSFLKKSRQIWIGLTGITGMPGGQKRSFSNGLLQEIFHNLWNLFGLRNYRTPLNTLVCKKNVLFYFWIMRIAIWQFSAE